MKELLSIGVTVMKYRMFYILCSFWLLSLTAMYY